MTSTILSSPTEAAQRAQSILRDGGHFEWTVIPLFALVVYVYAVEVERREWRIVLAGLAFWGMDWVNEIVNGLIFHLTNRAPLWGTPGGTSFLVLIGLNVEISMMFAIGGIGFCKMLPRDPALRVLGIPNRWFIAMAGSAFCVAVEVWLNSIGALTWDWSFWNARAPWLIFLLGYLPFYLVAFRVHDMSSVKKQAQVVMALLGLDAFGLAVFGAFLGWI